MSVIEKELDDLERTIEDAKIRHAEIKGKVNVLIQRLLSDHGVENLEEAEKLIDKWTEELKLIDVRLDSKFQKLIEAYEW